MTEPDNTIPTPMLATVAVAAAVMLMIKVACVAFVLMLATAEPFEPWRIIVCGLLAVAIGTLGGKGVDKPRQANGEDRARSMVIAFGTHAFLDLLILMTGAPVVICLSWLSR